MRRKSKPDDQSFVTKDALIIAKYWVRELGVKSRNRGWTGLAGLDEIDLQRIVGVTGP